MNINDEIAPVGTRLREIRTARGLTVKELSEQSGVGEKTIYRIETGEVQDPKVLSLIPLIQVLGCTADDLIMAKNFPSQRDLLKDEFTHAASTLQTEELGLLLELIRRFNMSVDFERYMEATQERKNRVQLPKAESANSGD